MSTGNISIEISFKQRSIHPPCCMQIPHKYRLMRSGDAAIMFGKRTLWMLRAGGDLAVTDSGSL